MLLQDFMQTIEMQQSFFILGTPEFIHSKHRCFNRQTLRFIFIFHHIEFQNLCTDCKLFTGLFTACIDTQGSCNLSLFMQIAICSNVANDAQLLHRCLNVLLTECWNEPNMTAKKGLVVLKFVHSIIYDDHLSDKEKRSLVFSAMANWSNIFVNFAICGNIAAEEAGNAAAIRQQLQTYSIFNDEQMSSSPQSKMTEVVVRTLTLDTQNIIHLIKTYLFTKSHASYSQIISFKEWGDDRLQYQSDKIWKLLFAPDSDPWNYPETIHKLVFKMYHDVAIWDHFGKYQFRDPSNIQFLCCNGDHSIDTLKVYKQNFMQWTNHILAYLKLLEKNVDLTQQLVCYNTLIAKHLICSYLLSGNETIKKQIDAVFQSALNKDCETENFIKQSLVGKDLKCLLKYFMEHPNESLKPFENENNVRMKKKKYNAFIQAVVDGVLLAIKEFEENIQYLFESSKTDDNNLRSRYFFAIKDHITSIIANIFGFVLFLKDVKIQRTNEQNKFVMKSFENVIFSSSDPLSKIIGFILTDSKGIFGCSVAAFVGNGYLDQNEQRINDLIVIVLFMTAHWCQYIVPMIQYNEAFVYQALFQWIQILKYAKIGKEWLKFMHMITIKDRSIKKAFHQFVMQDENTKAIDLTLAQYFDTEKIKMHQKKCKDLDSCSHFHAMHRKKFIKLIGDGFKPTNDANSKANIILTSNHDQTVFMCKTEPSSNDNIKKELNACYGDLLAMGYDEDPALDASTKHPNIGDAIEYLSQLEKTKKAPSASSNSSRHRIKKEKDARQTPIGAKKKKKKKPKQYKITQFYPSQSSQDNEIEILQDNVMPKHTTNRNKKSGKEEVDSDDDDVNMDAPIVISSHSNSHSIASSPKPQSFSSISNKKMIKIAPFNILDKEMEYSTKKMMFQIEYTNANIKPNIEWKYRRDLVNKFGKAAHEKLQQFNEEFAKSGKEVQNRYVVETIENKRWNEGEVEYYVKWEGYDETHNTWEPPDNLNGCDVAIAEYEQKWEIKQANSKKRQLTSFVAKFCFVDSYNFNHPIT